MATIDFAGRPDLLRVPLSLGHSFVREMKAIDGEQFLFPPVLHFPGTEQVWIAALVDPVTAMFTQSLEDVALVVAGSRDRLARLTYGDLLWAVGKFEVVSD